MGGRAGEKRWECAPKERIFMSGAAAARWARAGFWRERRDGDGGRSALPWAGRALYGGGGCRDPRPRAARGGGTCPARSDGERLAMHDSYSSVLLWGSVLHTLVPIPRMPLNSLLLIKIYQYKVPPSHQNINIKCASLFLVFTVQL